MKERPILFSGPMVRAILDGRKTQTRRIINPQPHQHTGYPKPWAEHKGHGLWTWYYNDCVDGKTPLYDAARDSSQVSRCRFGQPFDRLWVKETFCYAETPEGQKCFAYRADNWTECPSADGKWKPSIFMPRAASRITIEITAVRVERLQAITEEDAKAEGVECVQFEGEVFFKNYTFLNNTKGHRIKAFGRPQASYLSLWESINGPDSLAANPYVWVIEFKRKATR